MTPTEVLELARSRGLTIACAESLTAGLVCSAFADVPGSSAVLLGGVVAYATDAKAGVLGVDTELLGVHGPVDPATALAMADRARELFGASIGLATTGVAGPSGQDGHAPGEVYVAVSDGEAKIVQRLALSGARNEIRAQAVKGVIDLVSGYLAG